ncbi:helix-turn-helix domain-containing protein [Natrialbaceae archaeon GCM10025810]|uniref:helix-turn-helix domain-containing protein n=1 Tax=Halovalidus salilacus TaxID=3075124 RepID=UPI00360A550B
MRPGPHGSSYERVPSKLLLRAPSSPDGGESVKTDVAGRDRTGVRSQADGGVIAELRLDHDDLLLRPTTRRAPDVTLVPEYRTTLGTGQPVAFVTAYGDSFDAFETALGIDPTVADPVLVDRYPDRRVYRVALTDRAIAFVPLTADAGARVLEISSSRDGWIVQLRFPNREALVAFNDDCRERDVSVSVNHLRVSDDGEDGVVTLTAKQQELLTVAYEEGYFDVPRGISQDELADRLNVSKSAISQRLRRAIAELCEASLT